MRIVFFGSDDFSAMHLEALLRSAHPVVACVTKPDARQGRGMRLGVSPIKVLASTRGIDYWQPETLQDTAVQARLREANADMFVVVAYGLLFPRPILEIPKKFCVNVHGSLLPKYRGAAPIQWAVINGEKETGVTVQKMDVVLDAGDIIAQSFVSIGAHMTADVLRAQMAQDGARLLIETLNDIQVNRYALTPQDARQATYAPKLTKDMGRLDWQSSGQKIYDRVRGLWPWPGAYTHYNGKLLKVVKASLGQGDGRPGEVLAITAEGILVGCCHGSLCIQEVHPEAGKVMSAASFAHGHKIKPGFCFGR